jgi:hypothetical protein
MTDMATTFSAEPAQSRQTSPSTSATSATETQTVITEQQVLFSTAAAVALPPARTRRFSDAIHTVAAAVSSWVASAAQPPKPVYPKRHVWLENSLLSREMDRL